VGSTVTYHQVVKVPANTIAQSWPNGAGQTKPPARARGGRQARG
jgi:hypothetical protein